MRKLPITDDSTMDRYREQRTGDAERIQATVEKENGDTAARDEADVTTENTPKTA